MATVVRRKEPVRVPTQPTKADEHRLRWLGGYRDQATDLILDVIAMDERRFAVEEELTNLDARLADPALADHPKRPAAQRRRDDLERQAIDATLGRGNRLREFARIAKEMTGLIRNLSPAGIESCRAICETACTSIDPESDLWMILEMPPDPPDWCIGKQAANVYGWQRRTGRKS
jgi:hypothetical protein